MRYFHCKETIDLADRSWFIIPDRINKRFQLHPDRIHRFDNRVGNGQCFLTVLRLDIERKYICVFRLFQFDDLGFLFQEIDTDISIFLE